MKLLLKSGSFWFGLFAVIFLVVGGVATKLYWDWLHPTPPSTVSNSETLRNVGLLIGGLIAFVFAAWRSWVAERQANATQRQADTAQLQAEIVQAQVEISQSQIKIAQSQAETAQLSLLNERYQRAAEMIGSGIQAVRLGGITTLKRLAEDHPEQYHIQVMELLCAFARHPTRDQYALLKGKLREDVQAIMTAIGSRGESGLGIEIEADFTLDLREADLSYARLSGSNLSRANLSHAKLDHANFFDWPFLRPDLSKPIPSGPNQPQVRISIDMEPVTPQLTGLDSRRANLSLAILRGADLSDACLVGTDLSGAELSEATLRKAEIIYSNLKMATFSTPTCQMPLSSILVYLAHDSPTQNWHVQNYHRRSCMVQISSAHP